MSTSGNRVDPSIVYKILPEADWQQAVAAGAYPGSADDARDGFIHLSAADQLVGTASKHFRGQSGLVLVAFRALDLGESLVWEASRGGALFPHLYSPLPAGAAVSVMPLPVGADGVPVLPEGIA